MEYKVTRTEVTKHIVYIEAVSEDDALESAQSVNDFKDSTRWKEVLDERGEENPSYEVEEA